MAGKKKKVVPQSANTSDEQNDPITAPAGASDYKQAQAEEIEVLKAIYMDDFDEVESKVAWNKTDTSFKLHIRASSNKDVYATIAVTFTATYPKTVPIISLESSSDLRSKTRDAVKMLLQSKPKELLGEVMIYELSTAVQELLEHEALNKVQNLALPNLEEERAEHEAVAMTLAKRQEEEELKRQAEAKLEAKLEEDRVLQQMVQDEMNRRESKKKAKVHEPSNLSSSQSTISNMISFDRLTHYQDGAASLSFSTVRGLEGLRKGTVTSVYTCRPAVDTTEFFTTVFAVKRTTFTAPDHSNVREKIRDLENSLEELRKLQPHQNILRVLDFMIDATPSTESWEVTVLMELGSDGSLASMLTTFSTIPVDRIRSWTVELLQALDFYHHHGIVHKRIHTSNILFRQQNDTSPLAIKLADGGFQDALHDLQNITKPSRHRVSAHSAAWIAPELAPSSKLLSSEKDSSSGDNELKKTTKTDVWDLGIVFLQMLFGLEVPRKYIGPEGVIDATDPSEQLEDIVGQFFHPDARKRARAFDLIPNEFLREDVPVHSNPASPGVARLPSSTSLILPMAQAKRRGSSGFGTSFSRYASEWVEEGRLGKGGYGEVVKARKKVDSRIYAIKKIRQNTASQLSAVLSEVLLLSQLNHPYVVRYYDAWPEEEFSESVENSESTITSVPALSTSQGLGTNDFDFGRSAGLDFISSSGYPKIDFAIDSDESDSEDDSSEDEVASENGNQSVEVSTHAATEDDESNNLQKRIAFRRTNSSSRPNRAVRTTLYIQMEYCERHTLRDLIRKGLDETPEDGWRLFRQMLEGLVHIHQHGIIHRDLKPDNIFIHSSGVPRIGDFGLATTGQFQLSDKTSAGSAMDGDMTRSVGTTLYVAPELSSQTRGDYTQKVDMYSLGIIFFEMCFQLKTDMERDKTIRMIRQKDHTLPDAFKSPEKSIQGSIIMSLINHRPSERPSSAELLRSGRIPMQIEDGTIRYVNSIYGRSEARVLSTSFEIIDNDRFSRTPQTFLRAMANRYSSTLRHAIEGLTDQSSPYYHQLMSALFSQTQSRQVKDYTWDLDLATAPTMQSITPTSLVLRKLVQQRLASIFSRHGAVTTPRQQVFPSSVHYANTNAVQLLDSSGTLLQLPYDLTLANARAIARFPIPAEKSYAFGQVFRRTASGGAPRSFGEADFDIISSDTLDLALKEAEVIKVLDEVIDEFPCFVGSPMCFHLNDSRLLDIILDFCQISKPQQPAVKEVLSKLNMRHWDWQKIRSELRSPTLDIPSTLLDDLARFDFRDPPEKAMARIRTILETSTSSRVDKTHAVFSHVRTITAYLKLFNVRRKVYLSPLSCFNEKFYRGGILFQCLFDTKRKEVLAAGGRYDHLIEEYRTKVPGNHISRHAVGFNLSWDSIVSSMQQYLKRQDKVLTSTRKTAQAVENVGPWTPRRCDVLVASFDPEVLRTTGIKMMADLWANDVSAELAANARSPEELHSQYRNESYSWVVIIKHEATALTSSKTDLKIKNLVTKQDADVKSENLISHLRVEMRDREHREGVAERSKLLQRLPSAQDGSSADQRRNEVQVLMAAHRSKKSSKWGIVDAAKSRAQTLFAEYASAPIVAIETGDESMMDAIRGARLGDPESWRKAIQSIPVNERQYLQQVQGLLARYRKDWEDQDVESEKPRVAMVFNFRTGGILLYDLGL